MDKKFEHIDINNEKVYWIVNSAFEVFSKNDLEKASTNMVVKQAGISRGLLYHYFKDKQELFDFLLFFSMKVVMNDLTKKTNWEDSDFMNRLRQGVIIKIEQINKYPYMIDFYTKYANKINKSSIVNQTEEYFPGIREKFYSYNLDFSNVKEDVDVDKMISVIKHTFRGVITDYLDLTRERNKKLDIEVIAEKIDDFIIFFRKQFYK